MFHPAVRLMATGSVNGTPVTLIIVFLLTFILYPSSLFQFPISFIQSEVFGIFSNASPVSSCTFSRLSSSIRPCITCVRLTLSGTTHNEKIFHPASSEITCSIFTSTPSLSTVVPGDAPVCATGVTSKTISFPPSASVSV